MRAEVISIGDELTSGQRLDTNSQWLSQRLGELGIAVAFHTTVADDLAANVLVFRQAVDRADIVVATGGLGPTADDLTREALAAVLGRDLVLNEEALAHIRRLFQHRQRPMPERNQAQAMFPAGSRMIHNPQGTAPGIFAEVVRSGREPCRVFALPGVPAEMMEMWRETVAAEILRLLPAPRVIRHRRIKCFGVGESDLEQMLPDLIRRGREPSVGITVSGATITLRITAAGPTADECYAAMESTVRTIHDCLGNLVFGEEDDELQHAVARLLVDRNVTLATVEWGSAGLAAEWLGDVPLANGRFLGGLTLRTDVAARRSLGLTDATWPGGAKTPESATTLARECRARFGADYALAVGEFPPLAPLGQEPGKVYFALAGPVGTIVRSARFAGHEEILKQRAAKQALDVVRLQLLGVGELQT